ncbi:putative tetratricopeptide-like helical domain superfamily [Septoria linicola]|nr:putative tetratricopeptide-like helical domain superfamily [Septoria linicola]
MAVPPQRFQLDRNIWIPSLYKSVRGYWFVGLEEDAKTQNDTTLKRWWGKGRSEQDLKDMDNEVHKMFGPAVKSIGPEKLSLPEWKGYEKELQQVEEIAAPLVAEVGTGKDGADTLLALILLLDQMPRHMFRSQDELKLVYNHYDRLAWSVYRSFKTPGVAASEDSPAANSWYRAHPVRNSWFLMPLIHSEHLASQEEALAAIQSWQKGAVDAGDENVSQDLKSNEQASISHRNIVKQFGRFPHRNEGLGRMTTSEEAEWLKTGETFGVKQSSKE